MVDMIDAAVYCCPQNCSHTHGLIKNEKGKWICENGGAFFLVAGGQNPAFIVLKKCLRCELVIGDVFPAMQAGDRSGREHSYVKHERSNGN